MQIIQHPPECQKSPSSAGFPGVCCLQSLRNQAIKAWSCQLPLLPRSPPWDRVHWSSWGLVSTSQPWGRGTGPNSSGQAGRQADPASVLGQVGWPSLSLPREGLEALGCRLVCGWGWGLWWSLHVGEGGGTAVVGCSPHRGL